MATGDWTLFRTPVNRLRTKECPITMPRGAGQHGCDGCLQPLMGIRRQHLHAQQSPAGTPRWDAIQAAPSSVVITSTPNAYMWPSASTPGATTTDTFTDTPTISVPHRQRIQPQGPIRTHVARPVADCSEGTSSTCMNQYFARIPYARRVGTRCSETLSRGHGRCQSAADLCGRSFAADADDGLQLDRPPGEARRRCGDCCARRQVARRGFVPSLRVLGVLAHVGRIGRGSDHAAQRRTRPCHRHALGQSVCPRFHVPAAGDPSFGACSHPAQKVHDPPGSRRDRQG